MIVKKGHDRVAVKMGMPLEKPYNHWSILSQNWSSIDLKKKFTADILTILVAKITYNWKPI